MGQKQCVITGGNSGIGRAAAQELAARGWAVLLLCRSQERGSEAVESIKKETGNEHIGLVLCDLNDLSSVRGAAENVLDRCEQIDALINNAGLYRAQCELSEDGYEMTWTVNHLGHYLLTRLLLERIVDSAPARIVNVASEAHRGASIRYDRVRCSGSYNGLAAYSQSKLANVLFSSELSRRLEDADVTVNAVHPGVVATNIWDSARGFLGVIARLLRFFYKSPEKGSRGLVYLADADEAGDITGAYFNGVERATPAPAAQDRAAAQKLWDRSAEMVGMEQNGTS